jgi:hypothetical protein
LLPPPPLLLLLRQLLLLFLLLPAAVAAGADAAGMATRLCPAATAATTQANTRNVDTIASVRASLICSQLVS